MPKPEERIYDGLAQVAHAIRRSTAIYVAMCLSPEGTTDGELKARADDLAGWIGGKAAVADAEPGERPSPIGEPWPPP